MVGSDVWAPVDVRTAPRSGPASSAATLLSARRRLSSTKRRGSRNLAGDCRSDSSWTPDTISRTSGSSEEEQNNSAYYASRMPPVENYSSGSETDSYFQTTVSAGKAAYEAENLQRNRRVYQLREGRSPPQVDSRCGSVANTAHHQAERPKRIRTLFDRSGSAHGQQQNCDTSSQLNSSRSSESRHVSEDESECLDHQSSGAWLPRSATVLGSTPKDELLSDAEKCSQEDSEHFIRSRRLCWVGLHESPAAPLSRAAAAKPPSCSARNRRRLSSRVSPNGRVLPPQSSCCNGASIPNPLYNAVDQRNTQRATRAIQRSRSREVRAAVEKPRRNWERSLRSFQASLRMHSPTDEDGLTEATEEETDRISVDVNFHDCRGDGEKTDEGCVTHFSEEEAAVGYESDSASEEFSGYEPKEVQRASPSCVFSRRDVRYEPDTCDITLQKQLEIKARRRLQERRRRVIDYSLSVESGDAEDNGETGVRESSPERSYEGGRRSQQPHCAQRYVRSSVEVDSRLPSQNCNQQRKCRYPVTGTFHAVESASPFYSFAASHRDKEPCTPEELSAALYKRRARREAYLQHSSRMPMHRRRPVERNNPTEAEKVRGRREREEETVREVSGDTGGLFKENHTERGKDAQVCHAVGTEERCQQEESGSHGELSSNEEDRERTGESAWENQSLLIHRGDRRGTEESNNLPVADTTGMTHERGSTVEHRQKDARQHLSKSLVGENDSLSTINSFPCQSVTSGQRTTGAETTAEAETMLLRVQPIHPLQHQQRRLIKQEKKKPLNSRPDSSQSEAGNNSDSSSGPPSPRFGTPDASDDEEFGEGRANHLRPVPRNDEKSDAPTLGCRPLTTEFEVKNAGSNSSQPGLAQTPDNTDNYCDRNATEERRSSTTGDPITFPPTETGSEQHLRSQSNRHGDKLSDSPRCLSQDGVETASTLTTASPRGESSFFPASPLSSFPPARSAEEENTRSPLNAFSLPPRPAREDTKSGVCTQAATDDANESNQCYALASVEVLPSITTSPAASTARTFGDSMAAAEQTPTKPVAATPAVPAAEDFSTPREPCFVSVEEQQEKLERLRGAYMAKFSELQRSPVLNRPQEEPVQQVDSVKSRRNTNNCKKRIFDPYPAGAEGADQVDDSVGNSNDTCLTNCGKDGGLCDRKEESNNHNLSTVDRNDSRTVVTEEKKAAIGREGDLPTAGERGTFLCLPEDLQEDDHLQPATDGSVAACRSALKPPEDETGVTKLPTSEDATGTAVESLSTTLTKERGGDDDLKGTSLRTAAEEGRIERDADSGSIEQSISLNAVQQRDQAEEDSNVSATPAAQLQQENGICNDGSCVTSPGGTGLCVPRMSTNAIELEETKESTNIQSRHYIDSSTAADSTEKVGKSSVSAAAGTAALKDSVAKSAAKYISPGARGIPGAALLLHSGENQVSMGPQHQRGSKGEATGLTTALTPPVVAIPPSVPKNHPRARAPSVSISFSPPLLREREASQQKPQHQRSVIEFGSSEPPIAAGVERKSNSSPAAFARQRAKDKKPYLPLFEDTDSWTSAIAAAVSPSLSSFSIPALQAAARTDKEETSSAWSALAATATESQQSLFLRALLTPRAFSHVDESCFAADDIHSGSRSNPTGSSGHPTSTSTFPVFESKSGVRGPAANDSAHPLVAQSTQMAPLNLPETAEPACGPKIQEANADDVIRRPVAATASRMNFLSPARAAPCGTLLSARRRGEEAKEEITRSFSDSKIPQTPGNVYMAASPEDAHGEAEAGDARQEDATGQLADTSQGKDSVAEAEGATLQASGVASSSNEFLTSFVSTLKKKGRQLQERRPRVAVINADKHMEGLETPGSRYAVGGSTAAEASPVSCVIPPSSIGLSGPQKHSAIQSPRRRTDRESSSRTSLGTGQAFFHKEKKHARGTMKSGARTCAAAAAKSSRRSFSATRAGDGGAKVSSAVHEASASSLTPTGGEKSEEQRMAALAAVAEYLRANEAQKKKQLLSKAAVASHDLQDRVSSLTAREAEISAADASAWMKQKASTFTHTSPTATTPATDDTVAGEPRCCSTTAGCKDTRQTTSSFQAHKSSSGSSNPVHVSQSKKGNGGSHSSSREISRSSTGKSQDSAGTLRPKPTGEQGQACDISVGGTRESSRRCKEEVASGKAGKNSNKLSLLVQAVNKREQRLTTEGDKAAAAERTSETRSQDTPRQASHAPECLASKTEEEHVYRDEETSSNPEEYQ